MNDASQHDSNEQAGAEPDAVIVYDGECPVCSRYVRMIRLRDSIGTVRLVNARDGGPEVDAIVESGLNLDEGMALVYGGKTYHGVDCVNRLALLSSPSGVFNRLNAAVFRSATASRVLYPVLRFGRNTLLKLLGRSPLDLN